MDCYYINLAQATGRKERLERNFDQCRQGEWALRRFEAIDVAHVQRHGVAGSLRDSEKACFLSHQAIIASQAASTTACMVVEDDVHFGSKTCAAVDEFLAVSQRNQMAWDIVFTDLCVPLAENMVQLIRLRQQLQASNRTQVLDLKHMVFGGATAYIVNGPSLGKLHDLLKESQQLDVAYDIYLRQLIHAGKLKAFCLFPFLTTLSADAEASQIQTAGTQMTDLIWNTFRRLVWRERQVELVGAEIQAIRQLCLDDESEKIGVILGALLSSKFVPK